MYFSMHTCFNILVRMFDFALSDWEMVYLIASCEVHGMKCHEQILIIFLVKLRLSELMYL